MTTKAAVRDRGDGFQIVEPTLVSTVSQLTVTAFATQSPSPTAVQLQGVIINHASVTGAGVFTLDTAANLDALLPAPVTNDTFVCYYNNTGTQTVTITTNTGLTLKGTAAVPTLRNAILLFVKTGAAAWTVNIFLGG